MTDRVPAARDLAALFRAQADLAAAGPQNLASTVNPNRTLFAHSFELLGITGDT